MGNLRIVFMDSFSLVAGAIRAVTWGDWSHVGVLLPDGQIIDSRWSDGGVRIRPFNERRDQYPTMELMEIAIPAEPVIQFLMQQVGKPYDWVPLFGIAFHRDWQDDRRWFCSELVAAAIMRATDTLIFKKSGRATPQYIYDVVITRRVATTS